VKARAYVYVGCLFLFAVIPTLFGFTRIWHLLLFSVGGIACIILIIGKLASVRVIVAIFKDYVFFVVAIYFAFVPFLLVTHPGEEYPRLEISFREYEQVFRVPESLRYFCVLNKDAEPETVTATLMMRNSGTGLARNVYALIHIPVNDFELISHSYTEVLDTITSEYFIKQPRWSGRHAPLSVRCKEVILKRVYAADWYLPVRSTTVVDTIRLLTKRPFTLREPVSSRWDYSVVRTLASCENSPDSGYGAGVLVFVSPRSTDDERKGINVNLTKYNQAVAGGKATHGTTDDFFKKH